MKCLVLPQGEVHVWSASLEPDTAVLERLEQVLSEDERARARRFRFERDRRRYVAGRGLLRTLLADYLGTVPQGVQLRYGPYGKPCLADSAGLSFNLAHSGARALYAFGRRMQIGIDLELVRAEPSRELVAEHFFTSAEVAALRSLPSDLQPEAFLRCWTRKEAYIKARGEGVSLPLHDFEVTLSPGEPPALVRTAWSRTEPRDWHLYDLSDSYPGCAAAVAVRGAKMHIVNRNVEADLIGSRREGG
jgi:4'-phosphopantetheinyl transferase